jgi:hypothetical protein
VITGITPGGALDAILSALTGRRCFLVVVVVNELCCCKKEQEKGL